MEERNLITKAKGRLIALFLFYLCIAFGLIGFVIYRGVSYNKEEEAFNLSELASGGEIAEKQYVQLETDILPVLMMPTSENASQLYYVTDVNEHIYIVDLSGDTFKSIVDTLDVNTGKLDAVYQIKGTVYGVDEEVRRMAISNGFKIFGQDRLTLDNFSEYLDGFYIKEKFVSDRIVTVYQILALLGLFFLVLALGHVLPSIVRVSKGKFGIFDEKRMRQALEKYIPDREVLEAGIYSVGIETEIRQVFGKCICDEDKLIPSEKCAGIQVSKSKFSKFNVYIGVTQHYLIFAECERYKHLYEFNEISDAEGIGVRGIDTCILLEDIGTCFPLTEIQSCVLKNARQGAVSCSITMKNGSLMKLMFPKQGGLGMPHHAEYRETVMARLRAQNA